MAASMMTHIQRSYFCHRLCPKIDFGTSYDGSIEGLPMTDWPDTYRSPWLWLGASNGVARIRKKGGNRVRPQAVARSPGPPIFPAPKSQTVSVNRIVWHFLVGPLEDHEQLRYGGLQLEQANVNPVFYRLISSIPLYEPPTPEELGMPTALQCVMGLIRDGVPVSALAEEYDNDLIAEALALVALD
jgi:hypothetical protein